MTKQILFATTFTLIMVGCAPKNLNTTDNSTIVPTGDNTEVYQNVDPYGNGNGQYGTGQNGNGQYGVNNAYGKVGIQNVYFDSDQYNITPDKLGIISQNASLLRGKISSGARVKIEGHCDATGTDEYNYALGLRRAKAAKDALQNSGINPRQITLVSMGESSPECTTSNSSDCYAKNRRVEFKVIQ